MAEAVWGLKGSRAEGPPGISAEDLRGRLREATRTKALARKGWELLMRLVHRTFGDRTPPEELAWATIVLILKGKGEFWGIGLVEVAWKVCATVVNYRLRLGVVLHETLHGFRGGRGTGTSTLEAKLAQ